MHFDADDLLHRLIHRHEAVHHTPQVIKAGIGAFVAIVILGVLLDNTGLPLLIAPFGASVVLLFGHPTGVLAQPVNVVVSYAIAALFAWGCAMLFPHEIMATAIALGLTLSAMSALRVTHPPAGAIPLLAFGGTVPIVVLVEAIAVGTIALIAMAMIFHRLPPKMPYPKHVTKT